MLKKIRAYVKEHQMLGRGDRLVLGVSGGADSVCLLHLMQQLKEEYSLTLFVVHVNHGLRGAEADRDCAFTETLCARYGIPCHSVSVPVREFAAEEGCSEEEAGRILRYRAFLREGKEKNCTKIVLAHHMDDNAETVLFRLFRGTGTGGAAGIAPVTEYQTALVIRPLLCVTRREIENYLSEQELEYCTDSTNLGNDYSRNRIRNRILTEAVKVNSAAVKNINAFAERAAGMEAFLEKCSEEAYSGSVTGLRNEAGELQEIRFAVPEENEPILLELKLHKLLCQAAGRKKDISAVHAKALAGLCTKQVGSSLDLPYGVYAERTYEGLRLLREKPFFGETKQETVYFELPTEECVLKEGVCVTLPKNLGEIRFTLSEPEKDSGGKLEENIIFSKNDYTKYFDYDKIMDTVSVRTPRENDCISLHPQGGTKMLKEYLKDIKVPREQRDTIIIIAEGSYVLWIPGQRTGENRRISENTKRILKAEWLHRSV